MILILAAGQMFLMNYTKIKKKKKKRQEISVVLLGLYYFWTFQIIHFLMLYQDVTVLCYVTQQKSQRPWCSSWQQHVTLHRGFNPLTDKGNLAGQGQNWGFPDELSHLRHCSHSPTPCLINAQPHLENSMEPPTQYFFTPLQPSLSCKYPLLLPAPKFLPVTSALKIDSTEKAGCFLLFLNIGIKFECHSRSYLQSSLVKFARMFISSSCMSL